ncbi:MAG TPA: DUF3426 domain-containing protein [Phenylobacterium sp.]|nr:DUF3426 domain-containing protein [Phenylobacterium sp.]
MILTCPECAASYFVDDAQIGPGGRAVKCASCGARWTARPPLELASSGEEGALAKEPAEAAKAEPEKISELPGEALPKVIRAKAETRRKVREAAATGVVWAGMAAGLAVLIALAIVFRGDIVRLWPRTAGAYAAIGLPVNSLGLVVENPRAEATLQMGHAALMVSASIRNIESETITTPPLRISLLNSGGKPVLVQIARPANPQIPAGATRHFMVTLVDPPKTAADLEIAFAPDAAGEGVVARDPTKAHGAPKAELPLRGAADADLPEAPPPVDLGAPAEPAPHAPEAAPHG